MRIAIEEDTDGLITLTLQGTKHEMHDVVETLRIEPESTVAQINLLIPFALNGDPPNDEPEPWEDSPSAPPRD